MTSKACNWVGVVGTIILVSLGLNACGSSTSGRIVARVGHSQITDAVLAHWTLVEAVTNYESIPKQAIPVGIIPDPPGFTACVKRSRETSAGAATPLRNATTTQLKTACLHDYRILRDHVLTVLITFAWLTEESAAQDVTATDTEVKREFAAFMREEFTSPAEYQKFLLLTGQSLADEFLREKMDILSRKLYQKYSKEGRLREFLLDFPKRWAAKTDCLGHELVPNCSQYKGPVHPEARI